MENSDEITGVMVRLERPFWDPLVAAVGEELAADFMCMFAVATSDGRLLYAYKHVDTRGYIHLDSNSDVFCYVGDDSDDDDDVARYRPTELWRQLEAVFSPLWVYDLTAATEERVAAGRRAVRGARRGG